MMAFPNESLACHRPGVRPLVCRNGFSLRVLLFLQVHRSLCLCFPVVMGLYPRYEDTGVKEKHRRGRRQEGRGSDVPPRNPVSFRPLGDKQPLRCRHRHSVTAVCQRSQRLVRELPERATGTARSMTGEGCYGWFPHQRSRRPLFGNTTGVQEREPLLRQGRPSESAYCTRRATSRLPHSPRFRTSGGSCAARLRLAGKALKTGSAYGPQDATGPPPTGGWIILT